MGLIIICLTITLILVGAFLIFSPQFGGKPSSESLEKIRNSKNFTKGKFINYEATPMVTGFSLKTLFGFLRKETSATKADIPVEKRIMDGNDGELGTKVTWFGHSSLYVEIKGKTLLLDPVLSKRHGPLPMFTGKKFNEELPIEIDTIPELDAILISHDHYDHLDYSTIIQLKHKTKMFFVPLGVGAHLRSWGVDEEKITELDWWEEASFEEINFVATPSRHFSGRGILNKNSTLWCSWVIKSDESSLYFSGDTGYHKALKEIGDKYGPFDLTMLECGQYNEGWSKIHMMPEETVQAHLDLNGKILLPIHWGAFKLSVHSWSEPVERAVKQANKSDVKIVTPKIGEVIDTGKTEIFTEWWK